MLAFPKGSHVPMLDFPHTALQMERAKGESSPVTLSGDMQKICSDFCIANKPFDHHIAVQLASIPCLL